MLSGTTVYLRLSFFVREVNREAVSKTSLSVGTEANLVVKGVIKQRDLEQVIKKNYSVSLFLCLEETRVL